MFSTQVKGAESVSTEVTENSKQHTCLWSLCSRDYVYSPSAKKTKPWTCTTKTLAPLETIQHVHTACYQGSSCPGGLSQYAPEDQSAMAPPLQCRTGCSWRRTTIDIDNVTVPETTKSSMYMSSLRTKYG